MLIHVPGRPVFLLLAAAILGAGISCSLPKSAQQNGVRPVFSPSHPHAELGQLQVFVTDQTTDGRNLHIRGLLRNPYPEAVNGVRVMFYILSAPSQEAKVLDRIQKELEIEIAGGEQAALRLDLQSMYAGQSGYWGFSLVAFAVKRLGADVPPPPDWKD